MSDAFISYSRNNSDFVRRVYDALSAADWDVWVDWEGIPPSAEFMEEIYRAVEAADIFIFVISPDSLASNVAELELKHASKHNKKIIPVAHADVDDADVFEDIRRLNRILLRSPDDFDAGIQDLITAMETDLDWVRAHTRLLVRANEWETKAHDRSLVLRGNDLREAEAWLASSTDKELADAKRFVAADCADPAPTELQRAFVAAGRVAVTRRRRLIALSLSGAIAVIAVVGVIARDQQLASRCNALLGEAQALFELDPATARARALAAAEPCDGDRRPALDRLVARLLLAPRPVQRVGPVGGSSVLLSEDGAFLAVGSSRTAQVGGSMAGLQIWNLDDRALMATLEAIQMPPATLVVTDNSIIVVDTTGRLGIWGRNGAELIGEVQLSAESIKAMVGDRMVDVAPASRGDAMEVRVWDGSGGPVTFRLGAGTNGTAVLDPKLAFRAEIAGGGVRVVNMDNKLMTLQPTTRGGLGLLLSLAISPDGRLVAGANENVIDIWRRHGEHVATVQDPQESMQTWTLGFDNDGSRLITTQGKAQYANVWDLSDLRSATGREIRVPILRLHGGAQLRDARFGSDPSIVVTLQGSRDAMIWETDLPAARFDVTAVDQMPPTAPKGGWTLAKSGGTWMLQSLIDPAERFKLRRTRVLEDPTGRFELRGSQDGGIATLGLLQNSTSTELLRMTGNLRSVDLLGFSRTGRHFAVGSIRGADRRFVVHRCSACGLGIDDALQQLIAEHSMVEG